MLSIPAAAEFKPGKYIEPGPVSNWFVRHVRNGMIKRLELSETQLAQINDRVDPHREQLMKEIEVVKDAKMRLFQAIRTEPYDAAAVGLTFEELRAGELMLLVHGGEIYQDVWSILSIEQKAEADEIVAEIVTATELRFADFREGFLAGELLGQSTH
jgi:Spy/CpxP family protein refolding chaperone